MACFSEVVKNGLEHFAVGDGVVDILVVVCGSLFKDVKLFDSVEVGAFVWVCRICVCSCMLPNVCCCVPACSVYLEVWGSYWKALLCSLYLVLKSWPVCPMYALLQSGHKSM
jgi:hypothetical protein